MSIFVYFCELVRITMSFNLNIFNSLYSGELDSQVNYLECFVLIFFSVLLMIWVWACPYSWQPYQGWDSKIVEYIVPKSFESTSYIILAKRLFPLLSLSFIVRICCLNVRCWSNFKPKYLASLTTFIFCPLF